MTAPDSSPRSLARWWFPCASRDRRQQSSRGSAASEQPRRRWFPKFTLTVLELVRLTVAGVLKGKARRMAAGLALYQIMSDLVFRTTRTDRTLFDALVEAARTHGWSRIAIEDLTSGAVSYRKLLIGAHVV